MMSPDIVENYLALLKYLHEAGMSKMVRIFDPQMYLFAKILEGEYREGYSIETVYSREQAESMTYK